MISYVLLGTSDMPRACDFYDRLLSTLGAKRAFQTERMTMWAAATPGQPSLGVAKPYDGNVASVGNGVMVSLAADSPAKVDALHKLALELGGTDEGAPGPRGGPFYIAYFRDLDGNKLAAFSVLRK